MFESPGEHRRHSFQSSSSRSYDVPRFGIVEALLMMESIYDVRSGDMRNLKGEGEQQMENAGPGIFLAVPYFGYSRQDKRFQQGEVVSAKLLARLLTRRCDGMVVLDLHAPAVLEDLDVPVSFVSSMPEIAVHLQNQVQPILFLARIKERLNGPVMLHKR